MCDRNAGETMADRRYERCKHCDHWGWSNTHACPPIWEARIFETKWQNDWNEVRATDAEDAAKRFAEEYDVNGEHDIVRRGCEEIEVRLQGSEKIWMVDVSAETVPAYYATVRASVD